MDILERIKELACCQCHGSLENQQGSLYCVKCNKTYEVHNEIPYIISDDVLELAKEIAVQDSVATEYEEKRYQIPYAKKYHDWWTNKMLSMVKTNGRILDNGCGIGLLYEKLQKEQIVGLDLSSEMLKYASKYSKQLVLGNSQKLPFKDNSFDLIFGRSILHHLPKIELAIKEMHRVLRPGGEVVMAETNASLLSAIPRIIANKGEHFSEQHQNLNCQKLKAMFEPYFNVDKVVYFGYIAYPLIGFPDLINIFRFVPFKSFFVPVLMGLDEIISRIPLIRTQSWGIFIKATVKSK